MGASTTADAVRETRGGTHLQGHHGLFQEDCCRGGLGKGFVQRIPCERRPQRWWCLGPCFVRSCEDVPRSLRPDFCNYFPLLCYATFSTTLPLILMAAYGAFVEFPWAREVWYPIFSNRRWNQTDLSRLK